MTTVDLSPAFVRLAKHLRERIVKGEWLPGQWVPGEEALARELKVSVGTVRKSLDVLSGQGLITRHRGRGTFVARATDERAFTSFYRLVDRKDGTRSLPQDTQLGRERTLVDVMERTALGLREQDLVYRIRRRRIVDGRPLVLEYIAFPAARIGTQEWDENGTGLRLVYSFLERQCGISVSRVEDRLSACALPEVVANDLVMPVGSPVLYATRIAFDLQGKPVEYRRSWICTDAHDYLSELRWAASSGE